MQGFSIGRYLRYAAMTFFKPVTLIRGFVQECTLLYGGVQSLITLVPYELAYLHGYLTHPGAPSPNPFPKILPIPDKTYALYQVFFAPLVNVADYLVLLGVIVALFKLLRCKKFSIMKILNFSMFTGNVFSLLVLGIDVSPLNWNWKPWIHPMAALIGLVYLIEFIHQLAEIPRWKLIAVSLPSVMAFLIFRALFLR